MQWLPFSRHAKSFNNIKNTYLLDSSLEKQFMTGTFWSSPKSCNVLWLRFRSLFVAAVYDRNFCGVFFWRKRLNEIVSKKKESGIDMRG